MPVSDLPNVDFPEQRELAGRGSGNHGGLGGDAAGAPQFSTIQGVGPNDVHQFTPAPASRCSSSLDRDLDAAAQDVQCGDLARPAAAATAAHPPSYHKVNPADAPVLMMSLNSPTMPLSAVNEYAETMIAQNISMVSGVAQVNVFGARHAVGAARPEPPGTRHGRVNINALQRHNVNRPTARFSGPAPGIHHRDPTAVVQRGGVSPHDRQLSQRHARAPGAARPGPGQHRKRRMRTWYNNAPITLAVQRQPGTNTVDVVDRIRTCCPGSASKAVALDIVYDRSESIRESVHDVKLTLVLTVALVIVGDLPVPAERFPPPAWPCRFDCRHLRTEFGTDRQSFAHGVSVGFVVDDAIVILENIVRHMEMGKTRIQAALDGGREIGFTFLSMTVSLAAVFIPVLFMSGIMGRLFHEFAVVIMAAILISGIVSLSLTPMLCSRYLKAPGGRQNAFQRSSERVFDGMRNFYGWSLRGVLRHRFLTVLTAAGTLAATVYLYGIVPKGFIPSQDTGQLSG